MPFSVLTIDLDRMMTCFLLNCSRDAKCGKIQCLTSASKPIENNAVRIETSLTVGSKRIQCMGTHVYKLGQENEESQGDTLDPGLVMTGTKCGDDSVYEDALKEMHHCHRAIR